MELEKIVHKGLIILPCMLGAGITAYGYIQDNDNAMIIGWSMIYSSIVYGVISSKIKKPTNS